jgi:hypothetical protein
MYINQYHRHYHHELSRIMSLKHDPMNPKMLLVILILTVPSIGNGIPAVEGSLFLSCQNGVPHAVGIHVSLELYLYLSFFL